MFLKVPLHTISSCLDLLTKTMKQLPQQIKQRTLLMFLKVSLHTISSCLDLLTKTMKQLPQQIKQNITDVSESTVTHYI